MPAPETVSPTEPQGETTSTDGRRAADPLREIHDAYFVRLRSLLRFLGVDPSEIADLSQEVFVIINRRLPEFRGDAQLWTWIRAIAVRRAATHLRARRRWSRVFARWTGGSKSSDSENDVFPEPADSSAGPFERAELAEFTRFADRLLQSLPPEQRQVFVLAEREEMSATEIAEMLGIPENTVYSRLKRARDKVSNAVSRYRRGRHS